MPQNQIESLQLMNATDQVLMLPFMPSAPPLPERLSTLEQATDRIADLLPDGWENEPVKSESLHAAAVLACRPAVEALLLGNHRGSNRTPAESVAANLQQLASRMLEAEGFKNPSRGVVGKTSEIAMLSLVWWGISDRLLAPGSYVFPATRKQDTSDGAYLKNGFDLLYREHTRKIRSYKLQVKSSERYDDTLYEPDVFVVSPADYIFDKKSDPARAILQGIASNKRRLLSETIVAFRHDIHSRRRALAKSRMPKKVAIQTTRPTTAAVSTC